MKKKKYIKIKNLTINCESVNVAEKQYNTNYFSTVDFSEGDDGGGIPIIPTFDASTKEENQDYTLNANKVAKEVSDTLENELINSSYIPPETKKDEFEETKEVSNDDVLVSFKDDEEKFYKLKQMHNCEVPLNWEFALDPGETLSLKPSHIVSEYSGMNEEIDNHKDPGTTVEYSFTIDNSEMHTPEEISYWTNFGTFPEDE